MNSSNFLINIEINNLVKEKFEYIHSEGNNFSFNNETYWYLLLDDLRQQIHHAEFFSSFCKYEKRLKHKKARDIILSFKDKNYILDEISHSIALNTVNSIIECHKIIKTEYDSRAGRASSTDMN